MEIRTDPVVNVAHVRELLDSPAERPVLYVKLDEDDGAVAGLDVWAQALVPDARVVASRESVVEAIGEHPDDARILEFLPYLRDSAGEIVAFLAEMDGI